MTLTVCVGASGSGKTTFLNDVYKSHKCTYIRQYHNLRPYIQVSAIPNFDPTQLPYWDIYVKEKKNKSIIVGGTIAGQFMAGLSGGQRKLLLFELIFQRVACQSNLLIVLDEPFAGVTDDFVPFIVKRLNEMRQKHNVLLVTNDHVETLKQMADNAVTVSAIDRLHVKINRRERVERSLALLAMSIGDEFSGGAGDRDVRFFLDVELSKFGGIPGVAGFTAASFGLYVATFWNSRGGNEALVLVSAGMIAYFSVNPYLLQLVDWRIFMLEEAEALLHSSKAANKALKALLTLSLMLAIASIEFAVVNAVMVPPSFRSADFFFGILFDNASLMFPFVCMGLYTDLPFQAVQILGAFPFLLMIFFSTTFSPGAGLNGLNNLRYLFSRFYLWCMLPGTKDLMEGCPSQQSTLLYLILTSFLFVIIFLLLMLLKQLRRTAHKQQQQSSRRESMMTPEYAELQLELFGKKALKRLRKIHSSKDLEAIEQSVRSAATSSRAIAVFDSIHKQEEDEEDKSTVVVETKSESGSDDKV